MIPAWSERIPLHASVIPTKPDCKAIAPRDRPARALRFHA
jgi:hypothetical protein